MTEIRAMCAIGRQGQLGLEGQLPWEGNAAPEFKADVDRFFLLTRGHVIVAGPRTVASFPQWAHADRTIVAIRSTDAPGSVLARFAQRVVYIGGGPSVWAAYAPLIQRWDVTRLPYEGPADRYFDPRWLCGVSATQAS